MNSMASLAFIFPPFASKRERRAERPSVDQRKDKMMTQQDESTQPESTETTPTRVVSGGSVRFAYRRFGNPYGTPLVFLQHFRGSMDNWDPALLNGFAKDRTPGNEK